MATDTSLLNGGIQRVIDEARRNGSIPKPDMPSRGPTGNASVSQAAEGQQGAEGLDMSRVHFNQRTSTNGVDVMPSYSERLRQYADGNVPLAEARNMAARDVGLSNGDSTHNGTKQWDFTRSLTHVQDPGVTYVGDPYIRKEDVRPWRPTSAPEQPDPMEKVNAQALGNVVAWKNTARRKWNAMTGQNVPMYSPPDAAKTERYARILSTAYSAAARPPSSARTASSGSSLRSALSQVVGGASSPSPAPAANYDEEGAMDEFYGNDLDFMTNV